MSYQTPTSTFDETPAPQRKSPRGKILVASVAVMSALLGGAVGAASAAPSAEAAAAAKPVPTVTETQTKTVTTEVTPTACRTALDAANSIIEVSAGVTEVFGNTIEAIRQGSTSGIYAQNAKLEALTKKLDGLRPVYLSSKASCLK